ncbi:tryptase alpha/beta-1 [Agrilus planipennis]|uniref:Tryptase alpha/beta-1 n=1 Tax=Agrilus planipennis TaxID=224129 RepID=A0A1W4WUH1_AGRPL|nr:tryptase alpha/beta-1 [Agrilus planipennis]
MFSKVCVFLVIASAVNSVAGQGFPGSGSAGPPPTSGGGNPGIGTSGPPSGGGFGSAGRPTGSGGQNYVCVPIGTCSSFTIDVRIVTPGNQQQNPCPAGQEPCYTTGNNPGNPCGLGTTQCGTRLASVTSNADGFSQRGAFPWQAFIVNQTGYAGSGVLIDPYHVVTAAHKVVQNQNNPRNIGVYMGIWESTDVSTAQYRVVSRVSIHPQYNSASLRNDIAVLRLENCFTLGQSNYINTACLPTQGQSFVGQNCLVSGWGETSFRLNDAPTMRQKQVTVPIVPYATCRASYAQSNLLGNRVDFYLDSVGEICAGGQSMRDACTQDGGAPLVCPVNGRYTVAGLVIWGKGCGAPGVYGVYTNVPNYVNWIQNTVNTQ